MMMTRFIISTAILTILSLVIIADGQCRFQTDRGVIDLTSLGRQGGQPAFPDKIPPTGGSNYRYSYNPCYGFSEGADCQDVAACQTSLDGKFQFALGKQDSARLEAGGLGSTPYLTYSLGAKNVRVDLECKRDGSTEFEALGEGPENNYKFRLAHLCACWDGCGGGPPPTGPTSRPGTSTRSPDVPGGGLSGGGVFIIILVVLLVVYFISFAVFYRVRQQRSGTELIAHRTFWVGLPGYAKDGVVYLYGRVFSRGHSSY